MNYQLINGNSLDVLKTLPDNSVDAIVTDPPYGLSQHSQGDIVNALTAWLAGEEYTHGKAGFMGKEWDSFVPSPMLFKECLRVLKHGGHMLCFAGARTQDLMGIAIRLAGFELRDNALFLYGCLSEDTEILTSKGWQRYHIDIDKSPVLCYNKDRDIFEWHKPTETFYYENKHTAYSIKSDFTDQIVSRNHRVLVERDGELVFIEAQALECEENLPFLESVYCLSNSIYDVYKGASHKEQNLLKEMPWRDNKHSDKVEICNDRKTSTDEKMPCMSRDVLSEGAVEEQTKIVLFKKVQWRSERAGVEKTCTQGTCFMDREERTGTQRTNDGGNESKLEGRFDLSESQGSICHSENKICKVSDRIHINGSEGWLCNGASVSGCNGNKQTAYKNGSSTSHKSRCNGQQIAELDVIQNECRTQAIRTRKAYSTTLATVTPIEYNGNVWCVTVPTGAFVARRNGKIFITGNSGFPKGQNIAKGVEKRFGKEPKIVGEREDFAKRKAKNNFEQFSSINPSDKGINSKAFQEKMGAIYEFQTDEAKQWEGWNTNLKPAYEPIIMARKPLDGTVVENVLKHGVGGLNIDACRVKIEEADDIHKKNPHTVHKQSNIEFTSANPNVVYKVPQGRYPANIILDGSEEVEALFPNEAQRFFYCAKASKRDRDEGLEGMNGHPTVKNTALMRHLVRLVTPKGGIVLDPFMGSGSTGKACMYEGMQFIGIELNPEYVDIAKARIEFAKGREE